jgi:transcriptional regulator with GAF, ATPase, and Fis domain
VPSRKIIESELFGHEKGAFTGAFAQKKGKLEVADGGTVFLDEVGDMSLAMQAKLLRVLQERRLDEVRGDQVHSHPLPGHRRLEQEAGGAVWAQPGRR